MRSGLVVAVASAASLDSLGRRGRPQPGRRWRVL